MATPKIIPLESLSKWDQDDIEVLKAAGLPFLRMEPSVVCQNAACPDNGGDDATLLRCSGCLHVKYCSSYCQREDWQSHKSQCKMFRIWNEQNREKSAAEKELKTYMESVCIYLREECAVASRSGLLLPYKEHSLRETHFIAIHVEYEAPRTPINTSEPANVIAVRKLFTFKSTQIIADSKANDFLKLQLKARRILDKRDFTFPASYFALIVKSDLLPEGHNFELSAMSPRPIWDQPGEYRLNPKWQQFIENCFKRSFYPINKFQKLSLARTEDIELYETQEFIEEARERFKRSEEELNGIDLAKVLNLNEYSRIFEQSGPVVANEWMRTHMRRIGLNFE